MSKIELERVKKDVEIIKQAVGLELPFGWDSFFSHFHDSFLGFDNPSMESKSPISRYFLHAGNTLNC